MRRLRWLVNGFHPGSMLVAILAAKESGLRAEEALAILLLAWGIGTAHELGHVLGARAVGAVVFGWFSVPGYGRTRSMRLRGMRRLTVILGGPAAGFATAFAILLAARPLGWNAVMSEWLGYLGLAGMIDNLLNLIPVWQLDGAHALETIRDMCKRRTRRAAHIDVAPAVWRPRPAVREATRPARRAARVPVLAPGPIRVIRIACPRRPGVAARHSVARR
jgi:Zn-dependent protease